MRFSIRSLPLYLTRRWSYNATSRGYFNTKLISTSIAGCMPSSLHITDIPRSTSLPQSPIEAIDNLFKGRRRPSEYNITQLLITKGPCLTTNHISHLLQAAAKMKVTLSDAHLFMILQHWQKLPGTDDSSQASKLQFTTREATALSFGLNQLSDTPMARKFLSFLLQQDSYRERVGRFTPHQIGLALQGLKPFSSQWQVVREAAALLTQRVSALEASGASFTASQAGGALFALRGFSSESIEVQDLLISLTAMLEKSFPLTERERLAARDFALGVQSMSLMSNEHDAVRNFLATLLRASTFVGEGGKLSLREELTAADVARTVSGFEGMSGGGLTEVDEVMRVLGAELHRINTTVSAGVDVHGGSSSSSRATQAAMLMYPQDVSNCLWGLQRMAIDRRADATGLQGVVDALATHCELIRTAGMASEALQWSSKQIARAIFGLQHLAPSGNGSVSSLLKFLISRLPKDVDSAAWMEWPLEDLITCVEGMRGMTNSSHVFFVKPMFSLLLSKLPPPPHLQRHFHRESLRVSASPMFSPEHLCRTMNALHPLLRTFPNEPEVISLHEVFNEHLLLSADRAMHVTPTNNSLDLRDKGHVGLDARNKQRIKSWASVSPRPTSVSGEDTVHVDSDIWQPGYLSSFLSPQTAPKNSHGGIRKVVVSFRALLKASAGYCRDSKSGNSPDHVFVHEAAVISLVDSLDRILDLSSESLSPASLNPPSLGGVRAHSTTTTIIPVWKWRDIGHCVFSLQHLDSREASVRVLLQKLQQVISCGDLLSRGSECSLTILAHCFFGMKGMNANHEEVDQLMNIFVNQLSDCLESSTSSARGYEYPTERLLGMCLSGMLTLDSKNHHLASKYLPLCSKLIDRMLELRGGEEACHAGGAVQTVSSQTAAVASYYMRGLGLHQPGLESYMHSLCNMFEASRLSQCKLNNHEEVTMALLGFKRKFSPAPSPLLQQLLEDVHSLMLSSDGPQSSKRGKKKPKEAWTPLPGLTVALGIYGLSGVNLEHHSDIVRKIVRWLVANLNIAHMHTDSNLGSVIFDAQDMAAESSQKFPHLRGSVFKFPPSSPLQLRPHEIALTSYGLRQFLADTPEIRSILAYLTHCIHNNVHFFRNQYVIDHRVVKIEISMLMYGLKRMDGNVPEVKLFVGAVATWLEFLCSQDNVSEMGVKTIGNEQIDDEDVDILTDDNEEFNYLADMWAKSESQVFAEEADEYAGACEALSRQQPLILDNQAISMCMSGLISLSSNDAETRRLLRGITSLLRANRFAQQPDDIPKLSLWEVAKVMSGLGAGNMSLKCREVRALITELSHVISTTQLIDSDTSALVSSPTSVANKHRTVDELLSEISGGVLRMLSTCPEHVRIFASEEHVHGSRMVKGNVPVLHYSAIELMDTLLVVVHLMNQEKH